jgi:hypothetical protein
MEDEITEFLKKMGMKGDQPQENQWDRIIVPVSSYLIVGDVGTGKTALAFWLLETFSRRYSLTPCVVGLPGDKRGLLPENFLVLDTLGELTRTERVIALVDEADIQLPIEDTGLASTSSTSSVYPGTETRYFYSRSTFPGWCWGDTCPSSLPSC